MSQINKVPSNLDPLTIIMVDDSEADIDLFQFLLKRKSDLTFPPFQFMSAHTAEEGIDLIAYEKPDLLILDINLPDMDGPTLLEQLWQQYIEQALDLPPVLVISGNMTEAQQIPFNRFKQVDFFIKSVSIAPDLLKQAILNVMSRH